MSTQALPRTTPRTATASGGGTCRSVGWLDPFDLHGHHVIPAITTLTLCRDRSRGTATFLLHWRDPSRVATAGGIYDVIPAGEFQPSSIGPWSYAADLDLWRNIVREYSEELLGEPEHDGSRGTPVDYDSWPFYRALTRCRASGRLRRVVPRRRSWTPSRSPRRSRPWSSSIRTRSTRSSAGRRVKRRGHNRDVAPGRGSAQVFRSPEENVERLLADEPMAPPGAACLYLAWQHRDFLLHHG